LPGLQDLGEDFAMGLGGQPAHGLFSHVLSVPHGAKSSVTQARATRLQATIGGRKSVVARRTIRAIAPLGATLHRFAGAFAHGSRLGFFHAWTIVSTHGDHLAHHGGDNRAGCFGGLVLRGLGCGACNFGACGLGLS
jgi:hypothetical protein